MQFQTEPPRHISTLPLKGWQGYAVAVVAVACAVLIKSGLRHLFGPQPVFPLFYAAVLVAAWFGGFWPGLLATVLSPLARYLFLLDTNMADTAAGEVVRTGMFVFEAGIISWGVEALHLANRRVGSLASDLLGERYRLVDTANEGILTVDADSRIDYLNRRMAEILGYAAEQMLGRTLYDFVVEEDHGALRRALSGEPRGLSENWDLRLRQGGGTELVARLSASPIVRDGKLVGTLAMFTDVTSGLQTERALRRSEEELRMLTEALPQIVWTASADGVPEYFNRRWFDFTGLSEEESFSTSGSLAAVHPDDLPAARECWDDALRAGEPCEVEYRLRSAADGTYRWFLSRAVPVRDGRGRIVKWVGTCTDIDDHKPDGERDRPASIEQSRRG